MKNVRSSSTAFRFDPVVKDALFVIADRDGRSMANMIEWLIKQHCDREGLGWPPASLPASDAASLPRAKATKKT